MMESATEPKKQRSVEATATPATAADNSDDEKSDQDLVVDEVNDVRKQRVAKAETKRACHLVA